MGMVGFIRDVKRQLWHRHGFEPVGLFNGEPMFENIPDGVYEVFVDGKKHQVEIRNNSIHVLPGGRPAGPRQRRGR